MDCVQGVYLNKTNRAALTALFGPAPSVSVLRPGGSGLVGEWQRIDKPAVALEDNS